MKNKFNRYIQLFLIILVLFLFYTIHNLKIEGLETSQSQSSTYYCDKNSIIGLINNKQKCCPNNKPYLAYCNKQYTNDNDKYRCSSNNKKICKRTYETSKATNPKQNK